MQRETRVAFWHLIRKDKWVRLSNSTQMLNEKCVQLSYVSVLSIYLLQSSFVAEYLALFDFLQTVSHTEHVIAHNSHSSGLA